MNPGEYLRILRKDREKTLQEVATAAGISISYLSELERNVGKTPSEQVLEGIASSLDLTAAERAEVWEAYSVETDKPFKAILFVDGLWLWFDALPTLARKMGERQFLLDFGRLGGILGRELGEGIHVTRQFVFSAKPVNLHPVDAESFGERLNQQEGFFQTLQQSYGFDHIERQADYGRTLRLRSKDRAPGDDPPPKPVPIALASEMLHLAAVRESYDVAIVLCGEADYRAALEAVRRLGKRVAIASVRDACDLSLYATDGYRALDWGPIWLEDRILEIELKMERRRLTCKSIYHEGNRQVITTDLPPVQGRDYYCENCREILESKYQREEESIEFHSELGDSGTVTGMVASVGHKGFGFIRLGNEEGSRFYFYYEDLENGVEDYVALDRGTVVEFEVHKLPGEDPNHENGSVKKGSVRIK